MAAFTHTLDQGLPQDPDTSAPSCEVVVDPQELESTHCDMLLQVVGTDKGLTGLLAEAAQKCRGPQGGVPYEAVLAALSAGWGGLQEQHSRMQEVRAQVSGKPSTSAAGFDQPQCSTVKLAAVPIYNCAAIHLFHFKKPSQCPVCRCGRRNQVAHDNHNRSHTGRHFQH